MERLSVMGLVEPLGRLPELLRIRRELRDAGWRSRRTCFSASMHRTSILDWQSACAQAGCATAQLVSPTVWAWRPGRAHAVARAVDSLLCLFPFEPRYYQGLDVRAHYVGHPLVREFADVPDQATARAALGGDYAGPVIALLPGSRASEVAQLGEVFLRAARLLAERDPAAPLPAAGRRSGTLRAARGDARDRGHGRSGAAGVDGQSREAMIAADAVLLASGTASLEAMLLRRPMVIAYRMAPLLEDRA
jgi:lipid-A-disaccharide synthase